MLGEVEDMVQEDKGNSVATAGVVMTVLLTLVHLLTIIIEVLTSICSLITGITVNTRRYLLCTVNRQEFM